MIEEKIVILQRFCVRSLRTHAGEEVKSSWLAKRQSRVKSEKLKI